MKKKTFYIIRNRDDFTSIYEKSTMKAVIRFIEKNYSKTFEVARFIITKSYNKQRMNHLRKVFLFKAILKK